MKPGRTVFAQLMDFVPAHRSQQSVQHPQHNFANRVIQFTAAFSVGGTSGAELLRKPITGRGGVRIRSLRLLPHSDFVPSTRFSVACHSV